MDEDELRRANQDVMQMQQRMMEGEYSQFKKILQTKLMSLTSTVDQDDQLDALAKAIARQRDLSLNISSELELHEDLIDETDRALDQYVTLTHPSFGLSDIQHWLLTALPAALEGRAEALTQSVGKQERTRV